MPYEPSLAGGLCSTKLNSRTMTTFAKGLIWRNEGVGLMKLALTLLPGGAKLGYRRMIEWYLLEAHTEARVTQLLPLGSLNARPCFLGVSLVFVLKRVFKCVFKCAVKCVCVCVFYGCLSGECFFRG